MKAPLRLSRSHPCVLVLLAACGGSGGGGPATPPRGSVVVGAPTMAVQWRESTLGFASSETTPRTRRIATADVDGDGDLDVHFGDTLFRNLGGGGFESIPGPNPHTWRFALGDLDGDGDVDMVGTALRLDVWLNDGTGAFTDVTTQWAPANLPANDVALGDLDGDGDLDAVIAGTPDRVLRNDGSSFVDVTSTWLVGSPPSSTATTVTLADFDGDADLDLLAADGTRFFRHQGTALVHDPSVVLPASIRAEVAVADIDGDGDRDVLVSSAPPGVGTSHRLLRNDGTGHFADITGQLPANPASDLEIAGAKFGDVDGDGDQDMVWPLSNQLLRNQGNGTFTVDPTVLPAWYCHSQCCLFDFDGDGDLDLATAPGPSGECFLPNGRQLLENDGTGRFTRLPKAILTVPGTPADLDGDGIVDVVDATVIHHGLPNGTFARVEFAAACTPPPPPHPSGWEQGALLLARDITGDPGIDFVFATNGAIYRHAGALGWQQTPNPSTPGASAAAALDVDRDGDLDLVIGRRDSSADLPLVLLRNDGGNFVDDSGRLPAATFFAGALTAGDADGDGDDDLLVLSVRYTQPRFQLLRNDGGAFVATPAVVLPQTTQWTRAITLADVDRDGRGDVIVASSGDSILFQQQPDGSFTNESDRLGLPDWTVLRRIVVEDLDGDGDLDIATQDSEQRVYLQDAPWQFRNDESVRFEFPINPLTFSRIYEHLTDIDGDGDIDIGTRRNLARHLRFIGQPRIGRTLQLEVYAQPTWLPSPRLAQVFLDLATTTSTATLPSGDLLLVGGPEAAQLPTVTIPAPAGFVRIDVPVPDLPALVGLLLRGQALIVDPATTQGRATNVERVVIGG